MVLLIGFGNPGRGDDGLGPALARRIEDRALPGVRVKSAFQLTVEDALEVAQEEMVVFVDADLAGNEAFAFTPVSARPEGYLDSHTVSPDTVMALAEELFASKARGYTLGITGCAFGEIKEGLSEAAMRHLDLAEAFLVDWLTKQRGAARGLAMGR